MVINNLKMKPNLRARESIFHIIDNQIKNNDPPETTLTFKRLKEEGFDDFTVKQLIGQCVAVEIYDMLKNKRPFDKERFINHLNNLPEEPFEENKANT
jgi:hypothetical protein